MKKRIAHWFAAVVLGFAVRQAWAQGDAGQAGAFLNYGIGGRALGMGRAFVAISDDASGVYWNPAGLVGAKRFEFASMYSNLYYDSQFAHMGIVIPRPGRGLEDKVAKFLIGPSTAIGFGWIGLAMTGFEQRTATREYIGDFGLNENAFLASWAREEVGSWGIFRYGVTFKFVFQDFSGLESTGSADYSTLSRDWSGGMDFGFTFQPIHAPIFKIFSLRYLLPLRLGLSLQNLVQPAWAGSGTEADPFPRVIRWGFSYRLILKDWIPGNWHFLQNLVGNSQILLAYDREIMSDRQTGIYFGAEGYFPFSKSGFAFYPRFGLNNRTEGTSLGAGFCMPFSSTARLRIDYAYGFHPFLPEDNRFFLTLQMGPDLGPPFFRQVSERTDLPNKEIRRYLLRVIAEYPNEYIMGAVNKITQLEDSTYARRYFDLTGGLGLANSLFQEAKSLLRQNQIQKAKKKASDAAQEYAMVFNKPEHAMTDLELLNYGEALVIAQRIEPAITVLEEVENPSLRQYYLLGKGYQSIENWDQSIEAYQNAIRMVDTEQDLNHMVSLSLLGLGEVLIQKGQYGTARTTLQTLIDKYPTALDENYPRYPAFSDNYLLDDAQYLLGLATLSDARPEEGVVTVLKASLFYPLLQYGETAEYNTGTFIQYLETSSWDLLQNLTLRLLDSYFQEHRWPPRQ